MNIFPEVLLHYGQLLLALLVFFLTGRLVRWRLGITDRFFSELFFSAFIGMTVWIALYAIIKSGGRTINILWLLPAAYFLYQYWPKQDTIRKPFLGFEITGNHIGALLLGTLLCYGWEAYFFFWPGGPMKYHIPFGDSVFYTRVISSLVTTGIESAWGIDMKLSGAYEGITLYHYYELWLNGLFIEAFQTPSLVLLMAVNVPLFHCLVLIGILAWIEKSHSITWWLSILCFGLLFVNGVFLEWYKAHPFLALSEDIRSDLLDFIGKKTGPYYLYAIAFLLLLQRTKYKEATVLILSISIVTTVALPTVAGGIMLSALILWLIRQTNMRDWLWDTIAALSALAIISVFFLILGLRGVESGGPSELLANVIKLDWLTIKTKFNLFIGLFIHIGVLYWSWLLLLIVLGFQPLQSISLRNFIVIGSVIIAGATNWALLSPNLEAFQFFTHPTFSMLNLSLILQLNTLIIKPHVNTFRYVTALIGLILIIGINYNRHYSTQKYYFSHDRSYDFSFLSRLASQKITSKINGWGVSILHANEYVKTFQSHLPIMVQMGEYLPLLHPTAQSFSISTFEVPEVPRLRRYDLALMAFTQFVNQQKAKGTFQSIPQSQADFIRKHRMGYLIASKSAIVPPTIQPMITDSIVDSKSGERFYLLKP
ncbi:hypothetical protein [Rhodoflexus sp.]